ncbi:voltage-dependent calcium channel subunit alpha-2/delta-3 isoform X4 [Parasteatoda tepidariorum]|uniref:voltage-dependent calcium channel subunit alpha-2/delta-3 isoform X4 n=1 Tax=Parasteatoda tepidariorum TaxID=114398 RepID=UPI00077F9E67|nr:voltage-dependent calcium channel subunit alpha-2/delta-3 isoform X1 [Parasteatoda tepidariorum]
MEGTPCRRTHERGLRAPLPVWGHLPQRSLILALLSLLALILPTRPTVSVDELEIAAQEVKTWALKFGAAANKGCTVSTCVRTIAENFKNLGAAPEWVDANKMLSDMREEVETMMSWKADAITRIRDAAEIAVMGHNYEPEIKLDYINAKSPFVKEGKEYKPIEFYSHRNFDDVPINTKYSVVHVPTNVFDQSSEVLNAIKWTESLYHTFLNNLNRDSSLIYQFFGSATGFLRLFPAIKWRTPHSGPDMYDCRMRPWYIQAAASPKDIVILLDGSGSMTGLRKEIARNVVLNILETLSDNDFVTILRFSENVKSVVPCFENTLVQATEGNLREFRELLKDLDTVNIANFTLGLITAFELLQKVAKSNEGSNCNQAIMLITDGAPQTYEIIFAQYNWPNIPVRVFTYLIGREVTDMDEVQWMACQNRGYYTHVTTLAEVREQVQKYIPVMSRPVVLSGDHPTVWSSVYADITDVKLTDWLWQERERDEILKLKTKKREKRQKDVETVMQDYPEGNISSDHYMLGTSPNIEYATEPEAPRRPLKKKSLQNSSAASRAVQLLVTVATPVFDRRNFSNVTERIRSSKNIWIERTKEMRVANILGVAGTDVPIREIIKLTPPHKLGVNGYSFVVTNNGFVLYHPDLRPLFQDMLKPEYNMVDMAEVEIVDDDKLGPRDFDDTLLMIKNLTINGRIGWKTLPVKLHLDGMRRVVTRNNSYYYGPLNNTPFALVIALPEPYGRYRVKGEIEVKMRTEDIKQYFKGNRWRIHPDWVYCETAKKEGDAYISPEDIIRNFLQEAMGSQKFKWRSPSTRPPIYEVLLCDKDLVQGLVFDAKATDVDVKKCEAPSLTHQYEDRIIDMYGIVTTFVATRSGLLRYDDHRSEEEKGNSTERPFYETHTRATDELFYRRAVDYYHINSTAFVFAVPFDAGTRNTSLVTASQAIFVGKGKKRAPAAVVGVQLKHAAFVERFFNVTGTVGNTCMTACKYKCADKQMDCFLLDNNGFVVVSEVHEHTGKFFGEIDNVLFDSMIHGKIFRRVKMYDYQAMCVDIIVPSGPASFLKTPFYQIGNILYWIWSKLLLIFVQTNVLPWFTDNGIKMAQASDYYYDDTYEEDQFTPNKTRPRPCDKEFYLYEMRPTDSWEPTKGVLPNCSSFEDCDRNYIIQKVPYTNLVMVVTYSECACDNITVSESYSHSLELNEIVYDEEERCQRMRNGTLRKLPEKCVHHHPEENSIEQQCGLGSFLRASIYIVVGALLLRLL